MKKCSRSLRILTAASPFDTVLRHVQRRLIGLRNVAPAIGAMMRRAASSPQGVVTRRPFRRRFLLPALLSGLPLGAWLAAPAGPAVPLMAAGSATSAPNALQLAILRWYPANQTASFSVGSGPISLAFDGASIWVTNRLSANVTKLRASDGASLGTISTGEHPQALAFDGANIWMADAEGNSVTKLQASNGGLLGTSQGGMSHPIALAFDGARRRTMC